MAFAQRLARELKKAGHTQTELARRIGKSPSTICLWASGKRNPPLWLYEKLARIYPNITKD